MKASTGKIVVTALMVPLEFAIAARIGTLAAMPLAPETVGKMVAAAVVMVLAAVALASAAQAGTLAVGHPPEPEGPAAQFAWWS